MEPNSSERAPIVARSRQTDSTGPFILGGLMMAVGAAGFLFEVKKLLGLIVIGWIIVLVGLVIRQGEKRDARVRAHGLVGTAKITKTETVKSNTNGEAALRLHLTVELPGQAPYTAQTRVWTNQAEVPRIVQLSSVSVRVDADDKQRLLIDWG